MPCRKRYSPKTWKLTMSLSDQILEHHPNDPLSYVISVIKETFPEFSIERKKDSKICKAIAFLIYFFNKNFLGSGTFAFGKKVYVSQDIAVALESAETTRGPATRKAYCATLIHEFVHMLDQKKDGQFAFSTAYLFPQNLAVLSLFALGALLWWPAIFFLVFLGALAPWPAPYRLDYEIRGYAVGYLLFEKMFPRAMAERKWNYAIDALESRSYYFMTRSRQAHPVNSMIYNQEGPFLYDQIEQVFDGLEDRGHFNGN